MPRTQINNTYPQAFSSIIAMKWGPTRGREHHWKVSFERGAIVFIINSQYKFWTREQIQKARDADDADYLSIHELLKIARQMFNIPVKGWPLQLGEIRKAPVPRSYTPGRRSRRPNRPKPIDPGRLYKLALGVGITDHTEFDRARALYERALKEY